MLILRAYSRVPIRVVTLTRIVAQDVLDAEEEGVFDQDFYIIRLAHHKTAKSFGDAEFFLHVSEMEMIKAVRSSV